MFVDVLNEKDFKGMNLDDLDRRAVIHLQTKAKEGKIQEPSQRLADIVGLVQQQIDSLDADVQQVKELVEQWKAHWSNRACPNMSTA